MLKPIKKNATIGVIAPAYTPDPEKLSMGIEYLRSRGYKVVEGRSLSASYGHFAGVDQVRLDDLHEMYHHSEIEAIFCARGGWGCLKYIDKLDYELIRRKAKVLVGYSDITTLQLAIFKKTGIPSLSGPMVAVEMGTGILNYTEEHFFNQLYNTSARYDLDMNLTGLSILNEGKADGILLGGCLSLLASQLGTPYMPSFKGSILFIEDVGESSYKIDRYLAQLKQADILNSISGAILGEFIDCDPEDDDSKSFKVMDIIHEYFDSLDIPVVYEFPYGHGMKKVTMPIGVYTILDTKKCLLSFANPFRTRST
jgi:muramoyltetrapeptide carboxypeptidase